MEFPVTPLSLSQQQILLAYAKSFPGQGDPCYWASLWPSAVALAETLICGSDLADKKVLELGCGCGLAGIAAGLKGAAVTVTDMMLPALELAQSNWERNGLQPAGMAQLNWCRPESSQRYDLILGADILYQPNDFPDLIRSLETLLSPGGKWIIAEPGRPQAHAFFARMISKGFRIHTTHQEVHLHGECFEIGVSEID